MYVSPMTKVSVRDLRTRFPHVRAAVAAEGEVVVTERGKPAFVLRPFVAPRTRRTPAIDYFARLRARMPKALTAKEREAIDDENRGER